MIILPLRHFSLLSLSLSLSLPLAHTHTHTHTHIYLSLYLSLSFSEVSPSLLHAVHDSIGSKSKRGKRMQRTNLLSQTFFLFLFGNA